MTTLDSHSLNNNDRIKGRELIVSELHVCSEIRWTSWNSRCKFGTSSRLWITFEFPGCSSSFKIRSFWSNSTCSSTRYVFHLFSPSLTPPFVVSLSMKLIVSESCLGFRPPPGAPQSGMGFPPPGVAASSSPPPPPPARGESGAKLINGLNPERARMLGMI